MAHIHSPRDEKLSLRAVAKQSRYSQTYSQKLDHCISFPHSWWLKKCSLLGELASVSETEGLHYSTASFLSASYLKKIKEFAMAADFLYQKEKSHIFQQSFSGKVFYAADKVRIFLLLDSELLSHSPCVLQNRIQEIFYPSLT